MSISSETVAITKGLPVKNDITPIGTQPATVFPELGWSVILPCGMPGTVTKLYWGWTMAQTTTNKKMVNAVFRDHRKSEEAFEYLYSIGFTDSEINVLMSDKTRAKHYASKDNDEKYAAGSLATEGLGVGGAVGTAIGATLGAIVAIGTTVAVPGLGLLVAGPIVAALAGGGAGAVTGGLIGTLVGAGMTEQNASAYDAALRSGGIALGVSPRDSEQASEIQKRFKELGGENVCYC